MIDSTYFFNDLNFANKYVQITFYNYSVPIIIFVTIFIRQEVNCENMSDKASPCDLLLLQDSISRPAAQIAHECPYDVRRPIRRFLFWQSRNAETKNKLAKMSVMNLSTCIILL